MVVGFAVLFFLAMLQRFAGWLRELKLKFIQ
jgi:hypothetical protein